MKPDIDFDEDAIVACVDLGHRSGAKDFKIGYHEDEPQEGALNWYAEAHFKGARIFGEGVGPVEAADALSRRLLKGARCRRCGKPIRLGGPSAGGKGKCRWSRQGAEWVPGCGKPIDPSIKLPPYLTGR